MNDVTERKAPGRPKGSRNKDKQLVADKLAALDCDPIEGMVEIARQAMQDADLSTSKLLTELQKVDPEDEKLVSVVQAYIRENVSLRNQSLDLAGKMYKELAGYVHSKLKSVELSTDEDLGFLLSGALGLPLAGDQPNTEAD